MVISILPLRKERREGRRKGERKENNFAPSPRERSAMSKTFLIVTTGQGRRQRVSAAKLPTMQRTAPYNKESLAPFATMPRPRNPSAIYKCTEKHWSSTLSSVLGSYS